MFFEFIPLEEMDESQPHTVFMEEVGNYQLLSWSNDKTVFPQGRKRRNIRTSSYKRQWTLSIPVWRCCSSFRTSKSVPYSRIFIQVRYPAPAGPTRFVRLVDGIMCRRRNTCPSFFSYLDSIDCIDPFVLCVSTRHRLVWSVTSLLNTVLRCQSTLLDGTHAQSGKTSKDRWLTSYYPRWESRLLWIHSFLKSLIVTVNPWLDTSTSLLPFDSRQFFCQSFLERFIF